MPTPDAPPTTPRDLTSALSRAGSLQHGHVVGVQITEQRQTTVSHVWRLTVDYAGSAPAPPSQLLLKWPLERSSSREDDGAETTFYRELAPALPSPPIVRCLATALATSDTQWLILEDLSRSHTCPPWPERPSDEALQAAVAVLARIHAHWWDASGTRLTLGTPHSEESLRRTVHDIKAHLPAFLEELGEDLPGDDRQLLQTVFDSSLRPWLRLAEPQNLTITHGDAHTWNFLFPRSGNGTPFLIDWQTWHRDVGARDLAFLVALHWDPNTRRQLELPLLRQYHQELRRAGVGTYPFEDLLLEYRRCAVRNLTFPIIFWSRGFPRETWRGRLDCALAAFRDLNAIDLL